MLCVLLKFDLSMSLHRQLTGTRRNPNESLHDFDMKLDAVPLPHEQRRFSTTRPLSCLKLMSLDKNQSVLKTTAVKPGKKLNSFSKWLVIPCVNRAWIDPMVCVWMKIVKNSTRIWSRSIFCLSIALASLMTLSTVTPKRSPCTDGRGLALDEDYIHSSMFSLGPSQTA